MIRELIILPILLCPMASAYADVIGLEPTQDATLYEASSDQVANGAGSFMFVGKTGRSTDSLRRSLLQFELGELPAEAVVTSAELSIAVSRAPSEDAFPISLHRVLTEWAEGPSNATAGGGGQGIAAQPGDATWTHAVFPDAPWNVAGGDFLTAPSTTTIVGDVGTYTWSSLDMVNDLNQWLAEPDSNFGWIMIGDELEPTTARRINSRSNPDIQTRPMLTVGFEVANVPEPTGGALVISILVVGLTLFGRTIRLDPR